MYSVILMPASVAASMRSGSFNSMNTNTGASPAASPNRAGTCDGMAAARRENRPRPRCAAGTKM